MKLWKLPLVTCSTLLLIACSTNMQPAPKPATPPPSYITAGVIKVKAFEDARRLDENKLPGTLYLKTSSPSYSANAPVSMPTYLLNVMQALAKPSNHHKVKYPIYAIVGTILNMEAGKRKATDPLTLHNGVYAKVEFTATLMKNGKAVKTVDINDYKAQRNSNATSLLDKTTMQAATKMYRQLFS